MAMEPTTDRLADELLVMRCQDGDAEAFDALFRRWQPRLSGYARRLAADDTPAADAVQETWLAVVRGLRKLDDPATFRHWVYRIVTNKCADQVRRAVRQRELLRQAEDEARAAGQPDAAPESNVSVAAVRAAIGRLRPDRRAVLALHYAESQSVADISAILGVPAGTVKSRLHHARQELKRLLGERKP